MADINIMAITILSTKTLSLNVDFLVKRASQILSNVVLELWCTITVITNPPLVS